MTQSRFYHRDPALLRRNEIYLEILYHGLLRIRGAAYQGDHRHCEIEADHLHNVPSFISHAINAIRELMEDDGLGLIYMNYIALATASVRFCRPLNRSVTGSMNELEAVAKLHLQTGEWSPIDVSAKLNQTLLSAIGMRDARDHATPRDAFSRLTV